MLSPFSEPIADLTVVWAHVGRQSDNGNRIYAVAAAVIKPDGHIDAFDALIQYAHFGPRERYDANISQDQLKLASTCQKAQSQLREFIGRPPFVLSLNAHAHHADLADCCGVNRIVDLNLAAELFMQRLDSFGPKRLWDALFDDDRRQLAFSADEMVTLAIALLRHVCGDALNDHIHSRAAALRYYLAQSDTLLASVLLHACRHYNGYFKHVLDPATASDTDDWQAFLSPVARPAVSKKDDMPAPFQPIAPEMLIDRCRQMAAAGCGLVVRPSQLAYIQHVAQALNQCHVLCIEAGTGTGKTLGYLLPIFECLRANPELRIAVSTYTKSLQDQIVDQEIVQLKQVFTDFADIAVARLKGKAGYVCVEKLDASYVPGATGAQQLAWLYFLVKLYQRGGADIDAGGPCAWHYLNGAGMLTGLRNAVSAREGCTPKHRRCPAQAATARAFHARLIVTNHHKLVLLDKDPFLHKRFQYYIIDEANQFEGAVRSALKTEANSADLTPVLRYLGQTLQKHAEAALPQRREKMMNTLRAIADLKMQVAAFRSVLTMIGPNLASWQQNLLPVADNRFHDGSLTSQLELISNPLKMISAGVAEILDVDVRRQLKIVPRSVEKIKNEAAALTHWGEAVAAIAESLSSQNSVASYVLYPHHFILRASPVQTAGIIRDNIYPHTAGIVYTAATLRRKARFDSFREVAGLIEPIAMSDDGDEKPVVCRAIESPFAREAMTVRVHADAVSGAYRNKTQWLDRVARLLPPLIIDNGGRTLVLFASYDDMNQIAERVGPPLLAAGYVPIVQRPAMATAPLCDAFRAVAESVLFGVDSFWYGVDFKGDTLTQVIITRLPFPSPGDPIQMARKNLLSPREYWRQYHYLTEIKTRQGIGRLIRGETDRGTVVVLDSRFNPSRFDY